MRFKIIANVNKNLFIGKDNQLLYHIKNDLVNFKRMTINNVVIMGRKTYESLPNGSLSDRVNIIVTNNLEYSVSEETKNTFIVHNIEDAIELCDAYFSDKTCYVIGGASLYNLFLEKNLVDEMYITTVNDETEGDVKFPDVFEDGKWYLFYQSYTQRQRGEELTYKFSIYKNVTT